MMKVINLTWVSKKAKEPELIISNGKYNCVAFSHPCEVSEGEIIKEPLHAFMLKDLMISNGQNYLIAIIRAGSLAQKCVAKVIDRNESLVQIGNINILLDEALPVGAKTGDFI